MRKHLIFCIDDVLSLAADNLHGNEDLCCRPRILEALALAGMGNTETEAVVGLLYDDALDRFLSGSGKARVVAIALILYGVLFLLPRKRGTDLIPDPYAVPLGRAFGIGCFQALSILPGTSRSGSCLLGARALGVSDAAGAEFSFFMAIPVMLGVSVLKSTKFMIRAASGVPGYGLSPFPVCLLLIGFLFSYLVSLPVVCGLVGFVRRRGLAPFGVYRILLGLAVLLFAG